MRITIKTLLVTLSVILSVSVWMSDAMAWMFFLNGQAPESQDEANDIVVDRNRLPSRRNQVLVAGSIQGADLGKVFTVVLLRGTNGQLVWKKLIRGSSPQGENEAKALALDPDGNPVVVGTLSYSGLGKTFSVLKLRRADGSILWNRNINGTPVEGNDQANTVVVDSKGDVIAAGTLKYRESGSDFTVLKFTGAKGQLLWKTTLHTPSISGNAAFAVAVDSNDQIFAAGQTGNTYDGAMITVVKIDKISGKILWRKNVWGGEIFRYGWANGIAIDTRGNVVVAGTLPYAGGIRSFEVIKLGGSDGIINWRKTFFGSDPAGYNYAQDVAVSSNGHVFVAGVTDDNAGWRFALVKLNGNDGSKIWPAGLSMSPLPIVSSSAASLTLDSGGNVIAAGQIPSDTLHYALSVFKFNGFTGQKIWGKSFVGTAFYLYDSSTASAVALDDLGNPAAAGVITRKGTSDDFAVIKLNGTNGANY